MLRWDGRDWCGLFPSERGAKDTGEAPIPPRLPLQPARKRAGKFFSKYPKFIK